VVAAEVRKLAERSQKAAGEINNFPAPRSRYRRERAKCSPNWCPISRGRRNWCRRSRPPARNRIPAPNKSIRRWCNWRKVIQQNASASEEMAATTEELTSQSEQLVGALAFFHTGDSGHTAPPRAQRQNRHGTLMRPRASRQRRTPSGPLAKKAAAAGGGVSLKLKDKSDDLDKEFERF